MIVTLFIRKSGNAYAFSILGKSYVMDLHNLSDRMPSEFYTNHTDISHDNMVCYGLTPYDEVLHKCEFEDSEDTNIVLYAVMRGDLTYLYSSANSPLSMYPSRPIYIFSEPYIVMSFDKSYNNAYPINF